jgi:hypothetical protein
VADRGASLVCERLANSLMGLVEIGKILSNALGNNATSKNAEKMTEQEEVVMPNRALVGAWWCVTAWWGKSSLTKAAGARAIAPAVQRGTFNQLVPSQLI